MEPSTLLQASGSKELSTTEIANLSDADFEAAAAKIKALALPTPAANLFIPAAIKVTGPATNPDQQMAHVKKAFTRLAHCVLASNVGLPHRSTREAIALAIHLVVHIARVEGHRRVTELVAVRGYDGSADRFSLEMRLKERSVLEGAAL